MNGMNYRPSMGIELEPNMIGGSAEGENVSSMRDVLRILWRRSWVILLMAVMLTGATVGLSLVQTPIYETSIKILVGQERGTSEAPIAPYDLQALTQTMANGVSSRPIAEAVIRQQDLRSTPEELLENLTVEQVLETQFIQVSYTDSSPQRAQRVANAVGETFSEQVSEVSPSANAITATVWEKAVMPNYPVSPDPVRNGLLALVLGLMLGVGLAFLLEYLDDSWRSPAEVEQITGVPTFGIIPMIEVSKGRKGGR